MPIYEYRCSECGEKFEKLVRFSASTSEMECPQCDGQKVDKLISAFSARMSSTAAAYASACAPSSSG